LVSSGHQAMLERGSIMDHAGGKYYMVAALKRQYADRIPSTVLIGPYCSRMTNYTLKEILTDPRKSAEAHLAFYHRFRPDSLIVYNDIAFAGG
jgi:uroporphyrinogen-III decarboxylase